MASLWGESAIGNTFSLQTPTNGTWGGSECENVSPRTCSTNSPVSLTQFDIGAPDGGSTTARSNPNDNIMETQFTPTNGLLTLENGQIDRVVNYYTGPVEVRPTQAQQQLVDLNSQAAVNLFPLKLMEDPGKFSVTTFESKFIAPSTGEYVFYIESEYGLVSLLAGTKVAGGNRFSLTVSANQGDVVPVTIEYRLPISTRSDGKPVEDKLVVDWKTPGQQRKSFVPDSDVTWTHNRGFGYLNPITYGFVSPKMFFSADKTQSRDNYGLIYSSDFTVPTTGEYTFFLTSDNVSRLKFGNETVVNQAIAGSETIVKRTLTAGAVVQFELLYHHSTAATRNLAQGFKEPCSRQPAWLATDTSRDCST